MVKNKLILEHADVNGLVKEELSEYIHLATSENTRRAYRSDIKHFYSAGGRLPATKESIVEYLESSAYQVNVRTLKRRIIAIRQWHKLSSHPDPTDDDLVRKTLKGIARKHGVPKKQALAMTLQDVGQIVGHLEQQPGLPSVRDKALILVGFFGAFRRSELVNLKWEQIQFVKEGITIELPRSKTDQDGEGQRCVIPVLPNNQCPMKALLTWRSESEQYSGYVFRRFSPKGSIQSQAISADRCNTLIKNIAEEAGLADAEQMSAHSLRRGFATESARHGASMPAIQRHGRWKSTQTVLEYIEAGREFSDSAVNVLFHAGGGG
jgi:integrase